jgi:hypothetical protein
MRGQILVELPSVKFNENPFSRSRVVTCIQTDMAMLIGAFLFILVAKMSTGVGVGFISGKIP